MLSKIKKWVVLNTIKYAENRYSIFVWMRQINDRILRLENKEVEQVIQERSELEMNVDAKIQTIEAAVGLLQFKMEEMRIDLDRARSEMDKGGK